MSRESLTVVLAVLSVLLLALGGSLWMERQRAPAPAPARIVHAALESGQRRVTLEVTGLSCASCASRVCEQLEGTAGVVSCDVDASSSRAWVVCDEAVADSSLVRAVTRAGRDYAAAVLTR